MNHKYGLLIAFPLLAPLAQAAPLPVFTDPGKTCDLIEKADYIPSQEMLTKLGLSLDIIAASPMLDFGDPNDPDAHCSSVITSDAGHILTAGHCLKKCLKGEDFRSVKVGDVEFRYVDGKAMAARGAVCQMEVDGSLRSLKVLAASHCTPMSYLRGYQSPDQAENEKCLAVPDFAVLQLVGKRPAGPCIPAEPSPMPLGTSVASVGFPAPTARQKGIPWARDSDGLQQYMSVGELIKSPTCRLRARMDDRDDSQEEFERPVRLVREIKDMPYVIQTDAEIVPGNSGGPLITTNRPRILGVATKIGRLGWEEDECRGAGLVTSMTSIFETLGDLPAGKRDEMFACKDHAIQ